MYKIIFILNLTYFPLIQLSKIQNPDGDTASILEKITMVQDGVRPSYPLGYIGFLSRIDFLDNLKLAETVGVWIGYCILILISMHIKNSSEIRAVLFLTVWNSVLYINPMSSLTELYTTQIGILFYYLMLQLIIKIVRDGYKIFDNIFLLWINTLFYNSSPVLASVTSIILIIALLFEIHRNFKHIVIIITSYIISSIYGLYLSFDKKIKNAQDLTQFSNAYSDNNLIIDLMKPEINYPSSIKEIMVEIISPLLIIFIATYMSLSKKNNQSIDNEYRLLLRIIIIAFVIDSVNLFQVDFFSGRTQNLEFFTISILFAIIIENKYKKWPIRKLIHFISLFTAINMIIVAVR